MSVQRLEKDNKSERIELRVVPSDKATVELAAQLTGCNTSEFVSRATMEAANKAIEDLLPLELSKRDFDTASTLIANPRLPNEALKKAAERYRARNGS
jgi:uncharacterized protein (DUF1778 family)